MKKIMSIVFGFFIFLGSVPSFVFGQNTGDLIQETQDSSSGGFILPQNLEQVEENDAVTGEIILLPEIGQDETPVDNYIVEDPITDGGQSGQVMDEVFIPEVDGETLPKNTISQLPETQTATEVMGFSETLSNNTLQAPETQPANQSMDEQTLDIDLIISEVYFDSSNEWIEIYNNDNITFSGDLIISGASSSNKTISNFVINPGDTQIFTDTAVDSILDTAYVFQSNLGFTISDTQEINIQILYSGILLDTFQVIDTLVSSLDNKISFHKFIDTQNIIAADTTHTRNTTTGVLANPGKVYDEIIPIPDPELKITEVYFDGNDERFEITNISSIYDFSGDLSLGGDLNFDISTQILAGESIVFANSLYSMFQTGDKIQIISILSGGLNLGTEINFDTGEINLNLIRSGQTLDTFYAHETQVAYYTDADTSFEKIGSASTSRTTTVVGLSLDRYFNTNWGIAANPTKYFTTGENLIDVTQAREPVEYTEPLPIDCDDFWDTSTANISEVYYGNNTYSPYVEIRASDNIYDYYPYIKLEGSALSGIVAFATEESDFTDINMSANKRILISATDQRYSQGRDSVYSSEFSLTTGGRLTLYGRDEYEESRQILDIIYLSGPQDGNSLYIGTETNQCADIFDYQDKFSPGLTIGQSQFISITPDPIVQYISVGGGGSCSTKTVQAFNSTSNLSSEIEISTIKHFGNLQILKLKNKTDQDVNLRDYKLQTLNGDNQTIKGNTIFAKSTMSFVGNYGFPTSSDYCVNLLKGADVVDRYCRNSMTKSSILDQQNILNQLNFRIDDTDQDDTPDERPEDDLPNLSGSKDDKIIPNPLQTNTIKILDIDYNPDGSDTDNESITLVLLSGSQVDLSDYKIQYIKDGKSKNKSINGILTQGSQQIFKGNFTLPNSTSDKKPVRVNLIDDTNHIVDTYIYNPNKITEIPDGKYKVMSVIDGDTVKIEYAQQAFNIRLAGIDAPESSTLRCGQIECFGPEAKIYLSELLQDKTILFQSELDGQQDSFDRFVGYIFLDGENINQKMIEKGFAREYSYKNKSYKYQNDFKLAQKNAQANNIGLWAQAGSNGVSCNGQRLCPVQETFQILDYIFNIENIVYNPDGSDENNEIIKISMQKGFTVDFSQGFYLMINDNKKSLSSFGSISPGQTKILKGSFAFPNTKKTTVSLFNADKLFDTYVYDPKIDKLLAKELQDDLDKDLDKDKTLTGDITKTGETQLDIGISIVSILPNPLGKDTLGEQIGLLYFRQDSQGNFDKINLSDGFYIKIGDKKTYFKTKLKNNNTELIFNQETLFTGNFGLPNKSSCVEIGYENQIFDKFCYSQTQEGQKYIKSNGILESINTIDFGILNKSKLENIGNQVCLTYGSQKFYCKNMPYSKLSNQKVNQNKLYKEFFDSFENYLKEQRKIMYYDTDIKNYFNLLNEIEKAISEGKSEFTLDGQTFKTADFKNIYDKKYPKTAGIFVQEKLSNFIPSPIRQKYKNLRDEYNEYLMR